MHETFTFSIVQTSMVWEDVNANLSHFENKINLIQDVGICIFLPEMFSTGFSMHTEKLAETMNGITLNWMKKISVIKKSIIAGSMIINENENYFNRLIWMQPNKQFFVYDKRHLFSYADENIYFTAGKNRMITSVNGWRILPLICYDLRFPVWSRQQGNELPEYDILVYIANWPSSRRNIWKSLLIARAIENQCYVIGVNRIGEDGNGIAYSGDSCVISPLGEVMYDLMDKDMIYTHTFEKKLLNEIRSKYKFLDDADSFVIV